MDQRGSGGHRKPAEGFSVHAKEFKQDVGGGPFWFFVVVVALAVLAAATLGVVLVTSGTEDTPAPSATPTAKTPAEMLEEDRPYWTEGWNNPENKARFTELLHEYEKQAGAKFPNAGVLYNIGIDNCIQLRKGDTQSILDFAAREKVRGESWAINNAALDVYCPDQQQYRYLVHR